MVKEQGGEQLSTEAAHKPGLTFQRVNTDKRSEVKIAVKSSTKIYCTYTIREKMIILRQLISDLIIQTPFPKYLKYLLCSFS